MNIDTANFLEGVLTACFVATWIVLAIVGFFLFYYNKDAVFKREYFPRFIVLIGVLFVFFTAAISVVSTRSLGSLGILIIIVPAVSVISYMNLRMIKFCNKCGATLTNTNLFAAMRFCSRCGAELDANPLGDDRLE
jgi:hypothetical protein